MKMEPLFIRSNKQFIHVDDWIPLPQDELFKDTKGWVIVPSIAKIYNLDDRNSICNFVLGSKKGYNKPKLREHTMKYINYFLKFYDPEKEMIMIYARLKFMMDAYTTSYTEDRFIYDIIHYFLSNTMRYKIDLMNEQNYRFHLAAKKKKTPEGLKYDDRHGKILFKVSLIINLLIPLITHFMFKKRIADYDDFILKIYDSILSMFSIDIYNKIYETAITLISSNAKQNPIWNNQSIRGINVTLHATYAVNNILLNVVPKYIYSANIIALNFTSIQNTIKYKVIIPNYEFDFKSLSSSDYEKSDNESGSQFDMFEQSLTKENEGIFLQNKVNCEQTMKFLSYKYSIENDEIIYYIRSLMKNDTKFTINPFQKKLIFLLFYRQFGDVISINAINRTDYIKLMIIAKRFLISRKLIELPYIISGRVDKYSERKGVNSKQLKKIEGSEFYDIIRDKYKNIKMEEEIQSIIGTILASEFTIIDYYNKDIDNKKIALIEDYIIEEVLLFVSMI